MKITFKDIFVFVIGSVDKELYRNFVKLRRLVFEKYDIDHKFLINGLIPSEYKIDNTTDITFPDINMNPIMTQKFLVGLRTFDPSKYKLVLRINLSTYINFPNLLEYLNKINNYNKLFLGVMWNHPESKYKIHTYDIPFCSGTCMIFSQDVVNHIIQNFPLCTTDYNNHPDDAVISYMLINYIGKENFKHIGNDNILWIENYSTLPSQEYLQNMPNTILYRCNNYKNRDVIDIYIWNFLLKRENIIMNTIYNTNNFMFRIKYGTESSDIDITQIAYLTCLKNGIIHIPSNDFNRAEKFTDPDVGKKKSIFIHQLETNTIKSYDADFDIYIKIENNTIREENFFEKIKDFHKKLKIDYGTFNEEFPEQMMVVKYLKGNEKVLEIGGNIGRNSLIIAHILNSHNNQNFVSLESDMNIAKQLEHNKNINNLKFYIEASALSKRNLIQSGWNTIVSDTLIDGYTRVNIIDLIGLKNKYNIIFDTLVLDCEGAFYYILMDMPEILDNIKLIIMENDYMDFNHKQYIDNILLGKGLMVDYSEKGGWGPCINNFFEVWKK